MKRFVLGDIHGRYQALKDVLSKSKFDYTHDILIVLGDTVDGGGNTNLVFDELYKIKNLVFVIGNHDQFYLNFIFKGTMPSEWLNQGGANTLNSYGGKVIPNNNISSKPLYVDVNGVKIPKTHVELMTKGVYYYELDNMLFVHGGFNPEEPIEIQDVNYLMWDRSIIEYAESKNIPKYDKVFIGHTTTQHIERGFENYKCRNCKYEWEIEIKFTSMQKIKCPKCNSNNVFHSLGCTKPLKIGNLYCLDTGAGWDGKITLMNIDNTDEYWQSELQEPAITMR